MLKIGLVPWEELQQGLVSLGGAVAGSGFPGKCCSRIGVPCPSLSPHWQPYILYPGGESIHYQVPITKGDKICSQIERSKGNLSPVDLCFMNYHGNALDRTLRRAKGMVS